MEEEFRLILRNAMNQPQRAGMGSRIWGRFADAGGIELEVAPRSDKPRDPGFSA